MESIKYENKIGDWCGTYSGGQFWTFDPEKKDVHIKDIAHSLSYICRFNGHTKFFYSVAQHSLNVCKLMKEDMLSKRLQLLGLLHDASEAYICDIPRPIKHCIPGYKEAEEKIEKIIFQALDIALPNKIEIAIVKKYDNAILSIEAKKLMCNSDKWHLPKTKYYCEIETDLKPVLLEHKFLRVYNFLHN